MPDMEIQSRPFRYRTYIYIWLGLLVLTAASVTIVKLRLTGYAVVPVISIATIQSGLVLVFFMRMKDEPLIIKIMLFLSLLALMLIMLLTFSDTLYR